MFLKRRVLGFLTTTLLGVLLLSCSSDRSVVPLEQEQALATNGQSISRYHFLLEDPNAQGLRHSGFIIGLEKSPNKIIRGATAPQSFDQARLRLPEIAEFNASSADATFQRTYFRETFDDPKVIFLSHAIQYEVNETLSGINTHLMYSAYETTGFGQQQQSCASGDTETAYDPGWSVLDCLQERLKAALNDAKEQKRPYSHFLIMAMGWNNDQVVSVQRYNSLIAQTQLAAINDQSNKPRPPNPFNPLVIGLTWPSVWGGGASAEISRSVGHVSSYPARARDADEIGFGYANAILNFVLPPLERDFEIGTVAIGHSFGARVLTRAFASAPFLENAVERPKGAGPLVIGLQPAFSANRFRPNNAATTQVIPFIPTEGGPYQSIAEIEGHLAVTWSKNDSANPIARLITGAAHVGGAPGVRAVRDLDGKFVFTDPQVENAITPLAEAENSAKLLAEIKEDCHEAQNSNRSHYIDASSTIAYHSDIANAGVGSLIWALISCHDR